MCIIYYEMYATTAQNIQMDFLGINYNCSKQNHTIMNGEERPDLEVPSIAHTFMLTRYVDTPILNVLDLYFKGQRSTSKHRTHWQYCKMRSVSQARQRWCGRIIPIRTISRGVGMHTGLYPSSRYLKRCQSSVVYKRDEMHCILAYCIHWGVPVWVCAPVRLNASLVDHTKTVWVKAAFFHHHEGY